MKKRYGVIMGAIMVILLLGAMLGIPSGDCVLAEVTETVTTEQAEGVSAEQVTETATHEETTETTEGDTETSSEQSTEETSEEIPQTPVDETPPEITLVCVDEKRKGQEKIQCQITVLEEDFEHCETVIYVERTTFQGELEKLTMDNLELENGVPQEIVFSEEGFYQIYAKSVDGACNEVTSDVIDFLIDRTAPVITIDMGEMKEGGCYTTNKEQRRIVLKIQDASLVEDACEVLLTRNDEKEKKVSCQWEDEGIGKSTTIILDEGFADGHYGIRTVARDEAENASEKEVSFVIDNTAPGVSMTSEMDYEQWTDQDVIFQTTVEDEVSGLQEIVYKVKGEVVKKVTFQEEVYSYSQEVVAAEEADKVTGYAVVVEVKNRAGIKKTMKRQVYIDKSAPEVALTGVDNGTHYTSNQFITTQVTDISYKDTKTTYHITRTLDGKKKKITWDTFVSEQYSDEWTKEIHQEGRYEIYAISTDAVGHQSRSGTLSFVIDKTAPVVDITGVEQETMTNEPITLQFACEESFYDTSEVNIEVQRKLDGKTTTEQLTAFPQEKKVSTMERTFLEDGTYQVTISAKDQAGNVAAKKSITFSVDRTKPELQIIGSDNYKLWGEPITLRFRVTESYYEGNRVIIHGTRQDIDGNVENLDVSISPNESKISSVLQSFQEDGLYILQMTAKDQAGNVNSQSIHFVVDQTNPEINGVERYDGGYYQSFRLTTHIEDIFRDLTVVSYQMRLNGVEYNGTDKITTEGKYDLQIEVQDELGHESTQSIEFVVDRTAPTVQFVGVTEGETVHTSGEISWRLENQEDSITGIRVNGVEYDADARVLPYKNYGSYQIEVDSEDRAGNCATQSVYFEYAQPEKKSYGLYYAMVVVVVLSMVLVTCLLIGIRQKRRENERYDQSNCV